MDSNVYGNFSESGDEYVFKRFDTPRPWINYAWNDHILVNMDQRGRGYSLFRDVEGRRTSPIRDRLVYVKDVDTGEFWTLSWDPIRLSFDHYHCRHGLGYTVLGCTANGIFGELRITAAADIPAEIWELRVRNDSQRPRRLSVYPAVEFDLGGWVPYGTLENYSTCRRVHDRMILAMNLSNERPGTRNHGWFATSLKPTHYETRKREFLGGYYGKLEYPASVRQAHLADHDGANDDFIASFQYDLTLAPGESWGAEFANGVSADEAEALQWVDTASGKAFAAGLALAKGRVAEFDRIKMQLPDPVWTRFFNIWAKQQLFFLKDFARVYLIGFRDTLQDAAGLCAYAPEKARASIVNTLTHQYRDGSAMRGWCPDDLHKYGDSGVWIAIAVGEYLRETANFDFLKQVVPYKDGGEATVWEHQLQALAWFRANLGEHGLPKLYFGDWNDSLNIGRKGRGESVWLAMALVAALKEVIAIAGRIGDADALRVCGEDLVRLESNIEKHAWDGEWYLRGFDDYGQPVGTHKDAEGSMYAEPQSWAVIAGLNPARWKQIAASVDKRLRSPYGILVAMPPYRRYQERMGRISSMPPGWAENGSSYCHVTAFQLVADCLRRDPASALTSLSSIVPFNPALTEDQSWLEPYTFSNMFRGPDNPRPGATFKGWTSGTVPWAIRGLTHYMLGVRPEYDGLRIDPVMPKEWKHARVTRAFRNAVFKIEIINTAEGCGHTRCELEVNGRPYAGNVLRIQDFPSGCHEVVVKISATA